MVIYSNKWCDLHKSSSHDNSECRQQTTNQGGAVTRRVFAKPSRLSRQPTQNEENVDATVVQQQILQALSSMLNFNGKRPAQSQYVPRPAPGMNHSNSPNSDRHCYNCGKKGHLMASCPGKAEQERHMITWTPDNGQNHNAGSSKLATVGSDNTRAASNVSRITPIDEPSPFGPISPYENANARDIGPQPKLH
ncbi:hypothetical protein EDC01DRAFT_632188 [Geopyxis carbonaria]|nr:hypothetical protein EDC01DRAFT_632188 [Geopyxis carbonaria]